VSSGRRARDLSSLKFGVKEPNICDPRDLFNFLLAVGEKRLGKIHIPLVYVTKLAPNVGPFNGGLRDLVLFYCVCAYASYCVAYWYEIE